MKSQMCREWPMIFLLSRRRPLSGNSPSPCSCLLASERSSCHSILNAFQLAYICQYFINTLSGERPYIRKISYSQFDVIRSYSFDRKQDGYGVRRPLSKVTVCECSVVFRSTFKLANSFRSINCSITGDTLQAGHALPMNNKKKSENCLA